MNKHTRTNPLLIPTLKQRNPLVAATRFRKAGAHATKRDVMDRAMKREARFDA